MNDCRDGDGSVGPETTCRMRCEVMLTPPAWVRVRPTVSEWVRIAHVRVVRYREVARTPRTQVQVTVDGAPDDVACFQRIVRLNTADWS